MEDEEADELKSLTIPAICAAWLTANGYDGLCDPGVECGCGVLDLMPCATPGLNTCVPAHKELQDDGDWLMFPGKAEGRWGGKESVMEDDKFVYHRWLGDNFIWKVKRAPEGDGLHVGTAYCAAVTTMDWRREHCPGDIESYAPVSESEVRDLITRAGAVLDKEKRIKELEWKLANMVRWLDEHQPDVWKRGLWDALEPGE